MPVSTSIPIQRLSQSEFGSLSYGVMEHVFAIHKEFGPFCDEKIYKRELAQRMAGVSLEVAVDVTFRSFAKRYFLDVVVGAGGVFEFKCVDDLHPRHRAQLLHYLLLLDLGHAKLINMRTGEVQHEFVNAALSTEERRQFQVNTSAWQAGSEGAGLFEQHLISLLREFGTGLDLHFYEDALTHFLGGEIGVLQEVPVHSSDESVLGTQRMRLATPASAFKLTAFKDEQPHFADHCRRLLNHTPLITMLWANIARRQVTLTSILKTGKF